MSHLIISQGIPSHSRIGNSLVLLRNLVTWSERSGHTFSFPFPNYSFPDYLNDRSGCPPGFGQDQALLACSLPHYARMVMQEWEIENNADPYDFPSNQLIIRHSNILRTDIAFNYNDSLEHRSQIEAILCDKDALIVHEPFPWRQESITDEELERSLEWITPSSLIKSRVSNWLQANDIPLSSYISVHARLGDYREYSGGSFYFEPDFYLKLCQKLSTTYPNRVLLFTNEPSEFSLPGDTCCVVKLSGDDAQFTLMQKSLLIIGPPSTYSGLAVEIARGLSPETRSPGHIQLRSNSLDEVLSEVKQFFDSCC